MVPFLSLLKTSNNISNHGQADTTNTTYADHTHDYSQLKLQNRQKPNHYSWIARHTFSHPAGPENCKNSVAGLAENFQQSTVAYMTEVVNGVFLSSYLYICVHSGYN